MADKLEGKISASSYDRLKEDLELTKAEFELAKSKARSKYLALKSLDPENTKLSEIRDEARARGGDSPYD